MKAYLNNGYTYKKSLSEKKGLFWRNESNYFLSIVIFFRQILHSVSWDRPAKYFNPSLSEMIFQFNDNSFKNYIGKQSVWPSLTTFYARWSESSRLLSRFMGKFQRILPLWIFNLIKILLNYLPAYPVVFWAQSVIFFLLRGIKVSPAWASIFRIKYYCFISLRKLCLESCKARSMLLQIIKQTHYPN